MTFDPQTTVMSPDVSEVTSSMSSLTSATMVSSDVINHTAMGLTTEKPYEEYTEVKTAILIERIYVPFFVSVGLVFNFLCFVTFVFSGLRSMSTCVYMAAIAVLDSVVLVHAFSAMVRRYVGETVFYFGSHWTCGLVFFIFYFTIHFDVLVLLAMTVDRFIVVRFPLKAQNWCTPKSAVRVITGIGIFSFALNFQIFFNRRLVPTGNPDDPMRCWYPAGAIENFMEKIYTIIDSSIYSFIPFFSLLTLNLLIIRQLQSARKFSQQFRESRDTDVDPRAKGVESKADDGTEARSGAARKALTSTNINVMFLLVTFTFLLLTSPVVILLLYSRNYWLPKSNAERAHFRLIRACVNNIMFSNHAVNFLLYCVSGRRFRQELKKILTRFCCRGS